ncbi:hypothetical protein RCL1_008236 [Eukaryota sp. TZLM3-RCL]
MHPIYLVDDGSFTHSSNLSFLFNHNMYLSYYTFPSPDEINNFTNLLGVNYSLVMTDVGPSLPFIKEYKEIPRWVAIDCLDYAHDIYRICKENSSRSEFLKNFASNYITSDYSSSPFLITLGDEIQVFIKNRIIANIGDVRRYSFTNPLIRRAACHYLKYTGNEVESYHDVSTCADIARRYDKCSADSFHIRWESFEY